MKKDGQVYRVIALNLFAWSADRHDLGSVWQLYILKVWFFDFTGALLDISHHPRFGWNVTFLFIPIVRSA